MSGKLTASALKENKEKKTNFKNTASAVLPHNNCTQGNLLLAPGREGNYSASLLRGSIIAALFDWRGVQEEPQKRSKAGGEPGKGRCGL